MQTDVIIPARPKPVSTQKVHNPRRLWEQKQAASKQLSRKEYEETTREVIGKRLETLEASINKLVEVAKGLAEENGLFAARLEAIEAAQAGKNAKPAKAKE